MKHPRSKIVMGAVSSAVLLCCLPAVAQEDPGRQGQLSYGVGFDYDFDDGLEATSDVAVTLTSRTRASELELTFGTELFGDFTDDGTDDFEFEESFIELTYTRTGPNSALTLSGGYTETDLEDELVGTTIADGGKQETVSASIDLETGIEGPFGVTLGLAYEDRAFVDTTDPDLSDDTTVSADILARFELSRAMTVRARAGISDVDDDEAGGTERETSYVGIGLETSNASGLSFRSDLLFDRADVTTTAPASSSTEEGIGLELDLVQDRPAGSVEFSFSSRIDETGRRTEAEVTRAFDTRTGGLTASLGVVDQEGTSSLQVIGALSYAMELPDGELSAGLTRTASTEDGDAVLGTTVELSYLKEIDPISSWSAELEYVETEDLGLGSADSRSSATLSYSRDITPEWSLSTGYTYARDDDGDTDNSIFLNIGRDITFGF
jgi:hypothetical protein